MKLILFFSTTLLFIVSSQAVSLRCNQVHNKRMKGFNLSTDPISSVLMAFDEASSKDKYDPKTPFQLNSGQIEILQNFMAKTDMTEIELGLQWQSVSELAGELLYLAPSEKQSPSRWDRNRVIELTVYFFKTSETNPSIGKKVDVLARRTLDVVKATAIPEVVMLDDKTTHRYLTPNWSQVLDIMKISEDRKISTEALGRLFNRFLLSYDFSDKNFVKLNESQRQKVFYQLFIFSLE